MHLPWACEMLAFEFCHLQRCYQGLLFADDPLAFLRTQPQFMQMRQVVQQNPNLLPTILQQIRQSNPRLLQVV